MCEWHGWRKLVQLILSLGSRIKGRNSERVLTPKAYDAPDAVSRPRLLVRVTHRLTIALVLEGLRLEVRASQQEETLILELSHCRNLAHTYDHPVAMDEIKRLQEEFARAQVGRAEFCGQSCCASF